jgi:hypothetical protein
VEGAREKQRKLLDGECAPGHALLAGGRARRVRMLVGGVLGRGARDGHGNHLFLLNNVCLFNLFSTSTK